MSHFFTFGRFFHEIRESHIIASWWTALVWHAPGKAGRNLGRSWESRFGWNCLTSETSPIIEVPLIFQQSGPPRTHCKAETYWTRVKCRSPGPHGTMRWPVRWRVTTLSTNDDFCGEVYRSIGGCDCPCHRKKCLTVCRMMSNILLIPMSSCNRRGTTCDTEESWI